MLSPLDVLWMPMKISRDVRRVARAAAEIPAIGEALAGLHAEVAGLRSDLSEMPADTRRLVDDVDEVHRDGSRAQRSY